MIAQLLEAHHACCDGHFTAAEEAAGNGDLDLARSHHAAFATAMDAHIAIEDEVLFPRFEEVTGHSGGPTMVMRAEHRQMRSVLDMMSAALDGGDAADFLDQCETLHFLLQQHNLKEEQILYPMLDEVLAAEAADLVVRIRELPGAEGTG